MYIYIYISNAFTNTGLVAGESVGTNLAALARPADVRASVGAGLVFRTVFGRVELNLSHPLRSAPTDLLQPFQVGLSLRFL